MPTGDRADELVGLARRLLSAERIVPEHFPDVGCLNVGWNILLVMYVSHGEQRRLDITGVCAAVPAPATTVLRRLDRLQRLGFIDRAPDETDGRRTFVVLRPEALIQAESCIRAIAWRHATGSTERP